MAQMTPAEDMRKLIDIINEHQGETPYNLDGIEYHGEKVHLIFVPNPDYKPEDDAE